MVALAEALAGVARRSKGRPAAARARPRDVVVRLAARSLELRLATCRSCGTRSSGSGTRARVSYFQPGMLVERETFADENAPRAPRSARSPRARAPTPCICPRRTRWRRALYTAFKTPPRLPSEPWLHESLWHSIQVIFWGFFLSSLVGVPLGILCGAFPFFSQAAEPFIEFFRYLPAPAFGALAVAVLGIYDAPKIAIIFIGTFFQQVLVVANTTRKVDSSLLEAAQTLGASRLQLLFKVVVPAIVVDLYTDMRILLGWAWTYLIVAELVGTTSGITYFINQQARYRNYENVFAAIFIIGVIGLVCDVSLARVGRAQLFPWRATAKRASFSQALRPARPRNGPRRAATPRSAREPA